MSKHVLAFIVAGQITFFSAILVCLYISDLGIKGTNSISYYSLPYSTRAPYIIGFLGSSLFAILAAMRIQAKSKILIGYKYSVLAFGILILFVLVTPYYANNFLFYSHIVSSLALFGFEFLYACVMDLFVFTTSLNRILLFTLFLAGIFVWSANSGFLPQRFLTQLLYQLIFCLLFIYTAWQLYHDPLT